MSLDYGRIMHAVDVPKLRKSHVAVVGTGASATLVESLVRTGCGRLTLIDPDTVGEENLVRQQFSRSDIGQPKVAALKRTILAIDPECEVRAEQADLLELDPAALNHLFSTASLIIATTDRFVAQARVNEIALSRRIPAIWPGVYRGGLAGEIVFWREGLPCYRCLLPSRYRDHEQLGTDGPALDPPSDGATIFDHSFIDCIAGMIALGLLTRGSRNRFGTLIEELGDRNFIHVKLDPTYLWKGRDVTREQLGVANEVDTFFAWNTAVRRDPDRGKLHCPDCERLLGKKFGGRTWF